MKRAEGIGTDSIQHFCKERGFKWNKVEQERKNMIEAGLDLMTLTESDVLAILDVNNSIFKCSQIMATARKRAFDD